MRERRFFTFDTTNASHAKALSLFDSQPKRLRGQYVVDCILSTQAPIEIAEAVRDVVEKMLSGKVFSTEPKKEKDVETKASDLPESFLTFFDNF